MSELEHIKKLAGIKQNKEVNEKVDLNAAKVGEELPSANDVPQAMKMAKLKRKVEGEKEGGDVDFKGLFTGIAKGSISIDDKGKIAENKFGLIKDLDEACGKKHKKKMEEKKAAKDYDGDGEIESEKEEWKGSRDKAIKKAKELDEVAPPGEDAESFIRKNKAEFKNRYGDRGEEVLYRTAWKMFGESEMFPKESLSRYMVEIIVDDLKEGKDAETIAEETAFDLEEIKSIVEWFKNKKATS